MRVIKSSQELFHTKYFQSYVAKAKQRDNTKGNDDNDDQRTRRGRRSFAKRKSFYSSVAIQLELLLFIVS